VVALNIIHLYPLSILLSLVEVEAVETTTAAAAVQAVIAREHSLLLVRTQSL
jgi:hypothetical protein